MIFQQITNSHVDIELLTRIYESAYVAEFPDANERESLSNMKRYLELKSEGWYGKNNYHIVVVLDQGKAVGLAVLDYLADANSGVIEFLMTTKESRETGVGTRLLTKVEELLFADATRNGATQLDFVFAEMNDPFAPNSLDDNLDPFTRARIWGGWGYKLLDFPYSQPALSAEQKSVTNLLFIAKPINQQFQNSISVEQLLNALRGYMIWAMRVERPEDCPEYCAMRDHLSDSASVILSSLSEYTGYGPAKPIDIHEVLDDNDPDLEAALAIYTTEFPGAATDVSPDQFISAIEQDKKNSNNWTYRFWALRGKPEDPVEGLCSFYALKDAGFGGYATLVGQLRKTGRFPLLLARMEEFVRRHGPTIAGFYIECNPAKQRYFSRLGFHKVDFAYRQPPLSLLQSYEVEASPPLHLMYKDLGRNFAPPIVRIEDFLLAINEIFYAVYDVADPKRSPFWVAMQNQVAAWKSDTVRFASQHSWRQNTNTSKIHRLDSGVHPVSETP